MKITDIDSQQIEETVKLYFTGTYDGNADQLKRAFHQDAHITGNINNTTFDWTLMDFIERVTLKPTAAEKGEIYNKEIVFMDRTNDVASVKARVIVGNLVFTDYITLLKINGQWLIRNKSFTS